MGVIPFTRRRPQDRHNKFLTQKNEAPVPRTVQGKTFWGWVAVFFLPGPGFAPLCLLVLLSGSWVAWVAFARCPARPLRFLLLLVPWCFWGVCFSLWAPSRSFPGIPLVIFYRFWVFGSLLQKHRVGGTRGRVRRDGSDGWRSPVPWGDKSEIVYFLRQPSPASPADRFRTP